MRRVRTEFDSGIEAKGYEKIRSRVEVTLKDGQKLMRDSGEAYRGGPDSPLSDQDLQAKFTDCSEKLLDAKARQEVFAAVAGLENLMATSADLVISADNARMGLTAIDVGLNCVGPVVPVARCVGREKSTRTAALR